MFSKIKLLLIVCLLINLSIYAYGQKENFYKNESYGVEINGPAGWYIAGKDILIREWSMGTLVIFRKDPQQPSFFLKLGLLPVRGPQDNILDLPKSHLRNNKAIEGPNIIYINNKEASYTIFDVLKGKPMRRMIEVYLVKDDLIFQIEASSPIDEFKNYKGIFNQCIYSFKVK